MFFLKKMLLKFFDKVDRKIDDLLFERSFWIVAWRAQAVMVQHRAETLWEKSFVKKMRITSIEP